MSSEEILQLIELLNRLVEAKDDEPPPAEDDNTPPANMKQATMKQATMRSHGEDMGRITADDSFFEMFPEARRRIDDSAHSRKAPGRGHKNEAAYTDNVFEDRGRPAEDKSRGGDGFFDMYPEAQRIKIG